MNTQSVGKGIKANVAEDEVQQQVSFFILILSYFISTNLAATPTTKAAEATPKTVTEGCTRATATHRTGGAAEHEEAFATRSRGFPKASM